MKIDVDVNKVIEEYDLLLMQANKEVTMLRATNKVLLEKLNETTEAPKE